MKIKIGRAESLFNMMVSPFMTNIIFLPQIGPRCIDTGQQFTCDALGRTSEAE
jgi:hypothetical protein